MFKRENILGVQVSAINMKDAIRFIQYCIENDKRRYVCVTPAHGIMETLEDERLRDIFNHSGLTTPDGMSIVWLLKFKGHKKVSRVYGPDLLLKTCEYGQKYQWRHFFYGGKPGVAEELIRKLQELFPGIIIAGSYSPPFRDLHGNEENEIAAMINNSKADIVWVGISTPRQERWMAKMRNSLKAPVLIGIGAAFDFISGEKPQAPLWVQRNGLEWLFRLIHEPGRMWKRYIRYPRFVVLALLQHIGMIHYD